MKTVEKLGSFYFGKVVDPISGKSEEGNLLQYDSKNLTTHAVCVGMTGSGKTGLGISILEEAGLDKIPAIIIDPKGDLTNLLLTFPDLSPQEFRPWIDEGEAERKGMTADAYSTYISNKWKEGLGASGEGADRIKQLRESVELGIYTPGSKMGIPISILNSFAAPPKEQLLDTASIRDKIQSLTSSLLGLLGIVADPIKSREHILLSTLINQAWENGENLTITTLIQQVQKPPFAKIGALPIDTFFPPKERMELSVTLNNLLASPGFQVWMEGEPLDIDQLLYTKEGKPKLSIISIMHLSDTERMFFVTLLLNEFLTWMRRQSGTSSLRALLYMDEIFGFFPPTAMPPSKLPMLTLLKQARAFGIGVVLVTQNPVDLDYKGLSNCGTWFIGKLQTERDKARVIEGLKTASNGEVDVKSLNNMLSLTGNRTFIMRSIYEQDPIIFQTRWTLSYLRGPLTLTQIATLTDKSKSVVQSQSSVFSENQNASNLKPNLSPGISEYFVRLRDIHPPVHYEPRVAGMAKVHFVDPKNKIDVWENLSYVLSANDDGENVPWDAGKNYPDLKDLLENAPMAGSTFGEIPAGLMLEANYISFKKSFAASIYQYHTLTLYHEPSLNMNSKEGENEADFRVRMSQLKREKQDELIKKLKDKYGEKINSLSIKLKKCQDKVAEKQQKAGWQRIQTWISFGTTILEAVLGRKITRGTITQTGTSIRRAGQMSKDSQVASQAEEEAKMYEQQLQDMEAEMNKEISALSAESDPQNLNLETISIHPRKSDISVEKIALVWWPRD